MARIRAGDKPSSTRWRRVTATPRPRLSVPTFPVLPSPPFSLSRCLALTLTTLLLVLPVRAQEADAYIRADSVHIGERFELVLTARHDTASRVLFPNPTRGDTVLGDLDVLMTQHTGRRMAADGLTDSIVYAVTTFALDTAFVPPLPVRVVSGVDTTLVLSSATLVPVASVVPPDATEPRPVTGPAEFGAPLWAWVLLAAAVLLMIGLIAYYVWSRRRSDAPKETAAREPDVPPYDAAMQRLRRLETRYDLNDPAQIKSFYVELSELLRTYLDRRLGVHALEETTAELVRDLRALADARRLPGDVPERVRRILTLADLAKFAEAHPSAEDSTEALSSTHHTLDTVEDTLHPAEPPADGTSAEERTTLNV